MTVEQTGTRTDLTGGMPATQTAQLSHGLTVAERASLMSIAGELIPAAHGMPSAADVVTDERLAFVLGARPDLVEPLGAALRADLGSDVTSRLAALESSEPTNLSALQLVIVAAYYTDSRVRELIGYGGQQAIALESWPGSLSADDDLIIQVRGRGPTWRDPATGKRAVAEKGAT
jgi:hypothetical protein